MKRGHLTASKDVASVEVCSRATARNVAADEVVGAGGEWGPWLAREDCGRCYFERTRLLDGGMAAAASNGVGRAFKRLQGGFCSAVTWPRSLFTSVDAAIASSGLHLDLVDCCVVCWSIFLTFFCT